MTLVIKNSDHLCSALQLLQSLSHSESHSQSVRGGVNFNPSTFILSARDGGHQHNRPGACLEGPRGLTTTLEGRTPQSTGRARCLS